MNILKELEIGDKIEVYPIKNQESLASVPIISQITDKKEGKLFIANPIKQGMPYELRVGQQIDIVFYKNAKGVFSFVAEVLQKLDFKLVSYAIKPINSPKKIQRRSFFRLKTLNKVEIKEINEGKTTACFTKDISGGGFKIVTSKEFHKNQKIECSIFLDNSTVNAIGEIVRVVRDPIIKEYEVSVEFIDITESNRSKIIAFIFAKQRELRQKGLI